MSRPYQFSDPDNVSSPLDRRLQQPFPPGQPPSFKQNVNRAKTKKWIEAKSYSYEGDDWGDYDEDDEYGVASQPPPVPTGMRSVTGPAGPSAPYQVPRKQPSFDRGDERRAFSTGAPATLTQPTNDMRQVSNTSFAPSHTTDLSSMDPRHRADYSPTAEPAPLQSRVAPTSAPVAKEKPLPIVPPTALATEPIEMEDTSPIGPPIIRPADIYARMQAEREKERATPPIQEEQLHPTVYDSSADATPLDDEEDYDAPGLTETALSNEDRPRTKRIDSTPPQLNIASFGGDSPWGSDDFFGSGNKSARGSVSAAPQHPTAISASQLPAPVSRAPLPPSSLQQSSTLHHAPSNGMRTMVGQAFDQPARHSTGVHKQDSTRSNATDSTLSESDTEGSSDVISPIMSRVEPTTSLHDTTPVHIPAERSHHDSSEVNRLSNSTLRGTHFETEAPPRAPFASEERRRSLSTSPARSPARLPVVAPPSRLSTSEAAEVAVTSPTVPSPTDRAMREADLAAAAKTLPSAAAPAIAASEHEAQQSFLDRQPSLPSERSPRISRAESPTKGRVADLANRFSVDGRRGSQDSNRSSGSFDRGSVPNLSSSPTRTTAAATSLQAPNSGITTGRDGSLRPKMPGGWESFATTTTEAPSERPFETSHDTILDDYDDDVVTPVAPAPALHHSGVRSAIPETPAFTPAATTTARPQSGFFQDVHSPAGTEVDLAPTTERHQLPAREVRRTPPPTDHSIGAMAALTAAGAGLSGAFGHNDGDFQRKRWEQGDVMQRPYYNRFDSDMTETTAADTMPPTPLAREYNNPMESRSFAPNAMTTTATRGNPLASTSAARGMPPSSNAPVAASRNDHHHEAASVVAPAAAALSAAALVQHEHHSNTSAINGPRSPTSPITSGAADETTSSPTRSRAPPVVQSLISSRASHEQASSPTFAKTMAPVSPMLASSSHAENERPLDLSTVKAAAAAAPVLAAGSANSERGVTSDHPSNAPLAPINTAGSSLVDSQHRGMSPTRPPVISKMSTDESPHDLESDRLRKEIVRSLDPIESPKSAHHSENTRGPLLDGHESSAARPFSVIPKEYDYYFSDTDDTPDVPEIPAARGSVEATPNTASNSVTGHHSVPVVTEPNQVSPLLPATASIDPEDRAPSSLGRRFSWEDESEKQSLVSPVSPPQEPHPIPAGLAPISTAPAITAPTPITKAPTSPTTAAPVTKSTLDAPTRSIADHPRLSGEGLHVINVNSNDLHELPDTPVDRGSSPAAALAPVSPVTSEPRAASIGSATDRAITHETTAPTTTTTTHNPLSAAAASTTHPTSYPISKTLPYEPTLPSFREIMTIKSPEQRISTMIDTRKKWSTHDTGLSGWLTRTIEANPSHAGLRSSLHSQNTTGDGGYAGSPSASARHRTTPSTSLGRVFSRTSMDGSTTRINSSTASPSPNYQRASGGGGASSAQLKGKELLDRAGVLGGKGVSGAKGLFAKAKARARGSGGGADRGDE